LVSLLLVLCAAVALVIGLLQSGLAIIYVSIGCSVLAGVLLAVAVVRGRPDRAPAGRMPPPPQPAPQPAQSWQPSTSTETADEPSREREPAMAGAGSASAAPDSTQQLDQAAIEQAAHSDQDELPIADYDRLRATEVLPLLATLDAGQLTRVRIHEASGRNRFMVLSRIDRELEARVPADEVAPEVEVVVVEEAAPSGGDTDDEWAGAGSDDDAEPVDERPQEAPARPPTPRARAASGSILDNYEQLKVLEILPRLADLNADELAQVRRREQAGQRRAMIINRVDRLIVNARPAARAPRRERPSVEAPARRGRPAPSALKKAPGKARAAKAPVKKATAKKAPAKTVAASKAPAKKAIAKKVAAAKRAPASKTASRTSTPTERRAAPVKRTSKATRKR
jgi:hypothetical protein